MATRASAVLLVRRHGADSFEADPLSGVEGKFMGLYHAFRTIQRHGGQHPIYAEVRFYGRPDKTLHFKPAPVSTEPKFSSKRHAKNL